MAASSGKCMNFIWNVNELAFKKPLMLLPEKSTLCMNELKQLLE